MAAKAISHSDSNGIYTLDYINIESYLSDFSDYSMPSYMGYTWSSICWSPKLNLFCAISSNNSLIFISSDGITWTQEVLPVTAYYSSICWSPKLNLFCAVATGGTNISITSPDGITWTQRTLPANAYWTSICWSPELSLFCAVAGVGSNIEE
jgi:hypothetical protein